MSRRVEEKRIGKPRRSTARGVSLPCRGIIVPESTGRIRYGSSFYHGGTEVKVICYTSSFTRKVPHERGPPRRESGRVNK